METRKALEHIIRTGSDTGADPEIRISLARKLGRLLPDLSENQHSALQSLVISALGQLADDHIATVRLAVSESLCDTAFIPRPIARRMAMDTVQAIAEPVLGHCLSLTDDDLLEIIAARGESWVYAAIAKRAKLSETVSSCLNALGIDEIDLVLAANPGACFDDPTLLNLVEKGYHRPALAQKLLQRGGLPRRLSIKLEAVLENTLDQTLRQQDLSPEETGNVIGAIKRRIRRSGNETAQLNETEEAILDACAMGDRHFIVVSLAKRAGFTPALVEKIFKFGSPRAITALCWRSSLSMRAATSLQLRTAGLAAQEVLYARHGTDYPLSPEDMRRALSFFNDSLGT